MAETACLWAVRVWWRRGEDILGILRAWGFLWEEEEPRKEIEVKGSSLKG